MKKFFGLVLFLALVLAVAAPVLAATPLSASTQPSPQIAAQFMGKGLQTDVPPSGGVTLPVDLEGLIKLAVIFLVTQGLKSISNLLKYDLTGWAAAIAASISGAVILFFNALLSAVPTGAQASVAALLIFVVTVLGAFGMHAVYKGLQPKK